jgi:hypothetical protein
MLSACFVAGCGIRVERDFPHRLIGAEGQRVLLDDIFEILNDPELTDDQRRERLRDLGIEDEQLIDAMLES